MRTPFLGGYNVSRSTNFADAQCINLYPEMADTPEGNKDAGQLLTTPGLTLEFAMGSGPIRGFYPTAAFLWVVSGNTLYSIDNALNIETRGTLTTSVGAVSMIATGQNIGAQFNSLGQETQGAQLLVADGVNGYLIDGYSNFTTVNFPFPNSPALAAYQDGFGLLVQANSQAIWQSDLLDLSTWSALAFQDATGQSDNVVAIVALADTIWVFKQLSTVFMADAGTTPFAFALIPGAELEFGCIAAATAQKVGNVVMWLSQNKDGAGEIRLGSGYSSEKVSDYAVDWALSQYGTLIDAQAYAYQKAGHTFYVISFPSANATWAYDLTTQRWHQRASFYNGQWFRDWTNCACVWNGMNLVGDYRNGNIYTLTPGSNQDGGSPRKWLRSWRALAKPTMQPQRFSALTMDMQTGTGLAPNGTPKVMLRWSDDGGHTWSNYRIALVGAPGQTAFRVKFNRLGSTRRNHGLDRIFELSSLDKFDVALIGAEIE